MLVKVTRPFLVGNGVVATEGQVINVSDHRAKELEHLGVAVTVLGGKQSVNDAFPQRQSGGKTGAEELPPSLPVAPQPLTSENILKKSKGKRKQSRSTIP